MDTLTETIASLNETALKTVASLREQVLSFQRDVAAAYAKAADVPAWVPAPQPLGAVDLEDLVGQAYDDQVKRLESDKQFALALVEIWAQPVSASAATPAGATRTAKATRAAS